MNLMPQSNQPLQFEKFWRWLMEHSGCILRAGVYDATFFDLTEFHWVLFEEERQPIVQIMRGKQLVGEFAIERTNITSVQGTPDLDDAQSGHWLFEVFVGGKDDAHPAYQFLMSHGFDQPAGHQSLKH